MFSSHNAVLLSDSGSRQNAFPDDVPVLYRQIIAQVAPVRNQNLCSVFFSDDHLIQKTQRIIHCLGADVISLSGIMMLFHGDPVPIAAPQEDQSDRFVIRS